MINEGQTMEAPLFQLLNHNARCLQHLSLMHVLGCARGVQEDGRASGDIFFDVQILCRILGCCHANTKSLSKKKAETKNAIFKKIFYIMLRQRLYLLSLVCTATILCEKRACGSVLVSNAWQSQQHQHNAAQP
jgi:hypothetical protein